VSVGASFSKARCVRAPRAGLGCENQHLIDLLYSGIKANVQTEPPVGILAAA
jgi:hypothetical protein